MNGIEIGLRGLDLFLAEDLKFKRWTQLYRARIMVAALFFTILPTPFLLYQDYWVTALALPLSAALLLYRLKRSGAYRYAAFVQSLVLLMTTFLAAFGQKTIYTGAHYWIPFVIVFVSVMDGPRFAAPLGLLGLSGSLVLLQRHSIQGPDPGVFPSLDLLVLHLMGPACLVMLGVLAMTLTSSLLNEKIENDTLRQHITRAQTTHKTAIGQLVGQLAHEVNNPLAIVDAAVLRMQIMLRKQEMTPRTREQLLQTIGHALQRLAVVTEGLKTFAGGEEPLPLERAVLQDILQWVRTQISSFARSRGVTLLWKEGNDRIFVLCRPEQMAFVLSTLVHDAIEATYHQNDRRVWIELKRMPGDRIDIQVRDRGIWNGYRGGGAGLSVCRKLAEDHGGSLVLQKIHGENLVRLTLPLSVTWPGKK